MEEHLERAHTSRKCGRACKGAHVPTLFSREREREAEFLCFPLHQSEREREREIKRGRETERDKEREKEGGRERDEEYGCFVLFLKGMTGALAPF